MDIYCPDGQLHCFEYHHAYGVPPPDMAPTIENIKVAETISFNIMHVYYCKRCKVRKDVDPN